MKESALCEWRSWIPHEKIYVGIRAGINTARRKVASTKQFIKVKLHSQGGRGAGSHRWNQPLGCLGLGIIRSFWTGRSCDIQWGSLQSFGGFLPQAGRGSFWPYKISTATVIAAFLHGVLHLQCKCIKMSLGVTLGERWKRRAPAPHLWLFSLSAPRCQKPQNQDVVSRAFNV